MNFVLHDRADCTTGLNTMGQKIGFIGLGVMGFPMAGHLASAGHRVTVFNRSAGKATAWMERFDGRRAATPAEAAQEADIVFACVGDDADVREVTLGPDGAFAGMSQGAIFVDHTTASAELARELAAAASAAGFGCVDAPVSGGQAGAENAALSIMAGGEAAHFAKAEPVMSAYAKAAVLVGPAGFGQMTKMANQICIAGLVQGLAEALTFVKASGLDAEKVLSVIGQGAAQSWQMDNRAKTMIAGAYDFGFAVDWMRKDLRICLEEARSLGVALPVTALVDQFYGEVQALGGGRWDTSSLMARLENARAAMPETGNAE
ncbi:MAG: NAD(P)-dependent oxidoreductase [Pseudomonadota bacterium]